MRVEVNSSNVEEYLNRNLNSNTALLFHGLYKMPHTQFMELMDLLINYEVLPVEFQGVSFNETDMGEFIKKIKARSGRPTTVPPQLSSHQGYYLDTLKLRKAWRWSYEATSFLPLPVYPYLHSSFSIGTGKPYASMSDLVEAAKLANVCVDIFPEINLPSKLTTLRNNAKNAIVPANVSSYNTSMDIFNSDVSILKLFKSFFPFIDDTDTHEKRLRALFEINGDPSTLSKYPALSYWILGTHRPHISFPDWVEVLGRKSEDQFTSSFGDDLREPLVERWVSPEELAEREAYSMAERSFPINDDNPKKTLRKRYADLEIVFIDEIYRYKSLVRKYIWKNYYLARERLLGRFPDRGELPILPNHKLPEIRLLNYDFDERRLAEPIGFLASITRSEINMPVIRAFDV